MRTRYYSILRPIVPGSFPEPEDNSILEIENFDKRIYTMEIHREAWGYIEYEKELPVEVADEYELVCGDGKEDKATICSQFCGVLKLTRRFADLGAVAYDPNDETVTVYFPDHTAVIDVTADSGIAMITDILKTLND